MTFAGDWQAFNGTLSMEGRKPPKEVAVPPFGIGPLLLLNVCSLVQLLPMDGSPALVPTPGGAGKFMNLGVPGVVAVALAGGCHGLGPAAVETMGAVASAATEMQPARSRG